MAEEGKSRGLPPEKWDELRAAYEGGESESSLSKRFGPDRKTIRARKLKENWIPHASPQVGEAEVKAIRTEARSKIIDIATGKAIEKMDVSGTLNDVADDIAEVLRRHTSIASGLMKASDELLQDFLNSKDEELASTREQSGRDVITRQGRAEVFAQLVMGIKQAVSLSREIAGKRAGDPSEKVEKPISKGITIRHERLETVKIPVDENGRMVG